MAGERPAGPGCEVREGFSVARGSFRHKVVFCSAARGGEQRVLASLF